MVSGDRVQVRGDLQLVGPTTILKQVAGSGTMDRVWWRALGNANKGRPQNDVISEMFRGRTSSNANMYVNVNVNVCMYVNVKTVLQHY